MCPLTFLACVSPVAGQAEAEEWINLVDAGASIFTWLRLTVIDIFREGEKWEKITDMSIPEE